MRSKISFFNTTIFKKNLTHFWPIWGIYLVFMICVLPVNIFLSLSVSYEGLTQAQAADMRMSSYVYCVRGSMSPGISIVIAIVAAMAVFSYLYNVRSSHMFHALPIKRETMFVTNYLSGLICILTPVLIAFLLSVFVCALKGITSLEYLFVWMLCMMGMEFFFYSMTVLVGMFTGFLLAVPVLTVLLNFLFIGCRYMVTSLIGMIGYGLSESYASRSVSIFSPLYYLISRFGIQMGTNADNTLNVSVYGTKYVAIYTVVGIVFAIVAFLMYRKRRIETTSDMLSINMVKPVFRWGFAGCAACLGTMIVGRFFPYAISACKTFVLDTVILAVFGIIAFFAAQMILEKQARVFHKKRFVECGVFLILVVSFMVCIEKNAFGLETKVPNAEDVAYAQLYMYYPIYEDNTQEIEEITQIHQQIIDSKKEYEDYQSGKMKDKRTNHVEFRYHMKDGTIMVRSYNIPADADYKAKKSSSVAEIAKLSEVTDYFLSSLICLNYEDVTIRGASIGFYDDELTYDAVDFQNIEAEKLYEAMLEDLENGNIDIVCNSDYYYDEDIDAGKVYANSLNFDIWCEDGIQTQKWWDYESYNNVAQNAAKESSFGIRFNEHSSAIIAALKEAGAFDGDHELITEKQYNEYGKELYGDQW